MVCKRHEPQNAVNAKNQKQSGLCPIGQLSLGNKKYLDNHKLWIIAEEGAQVIEKIYNLHKSIIIQQLFEKISKE